MPLSDKQIKSIPKILANRTIEAGCIAAGIDRSSYFRWLKDPAFETEIKTQRKQIVDAAYALLQQAHEKAAQALIELLDTDDERVKIRAAESILDRYVNFIQGEELELRLAEVEKKIDDLLGEKSKSSAKSDGCRRNVG